MITGDTAFDAENGMGMMIKNIKKGNFKPIPGTVSESLKDLLNSMMTVSISDRFSASQCLEHRWF
jgi:serine/threonine protein kinase